MTEDIKDRVYPFKSPESQREVQELFDAKRIKNITAGKAALTSGEYRPFVGFSKEGMDKLFVLELELDEESRQIIKERVTEPMESITSNLGISEIIFAGTGDQEPHVTLHVGRFDNMTPERQEKIRQWLAEGSGEKGEHMSHLRWAADILVGLKFDIDTVVCSGRDTYICAGEAEGNQGATYRVRRIFERVLERAQKKFATSEEEKIAPHYPRYDDIFHASVARFTGEVKPAKLTVFRERVNNKIGEDLKENPITIEIKAANLIIATQGVQKRKPELLT